jgi:hypothetical protein
MDASDKEKPDGKISIFLQDGARVIGRHGLKLGEDGDFLFILNESGAREAIPKRLVVRYLEVV